MNLFASLTVVKISEERITDLFSIISEKRSRMIMRARVTSTGSSENKGVMIYHRARYEYASSKLKLQSNKTGSLSKSRMIYKLDGDDGELHVSGYSPQSFAREGR